MPENSPRSSDRKLGLIGPIVIAVVATLIALGALIFGPADVEPPPPPAPAPPAAPPPPMVPPQEAVLDRAGLLVQANAIAAAYTMDGNAPPEGGRDPLAGKRFSIRIPFGCDGPQVQPGGAQTYYEFNPETRSLRLVARQAVWTGLPIIQEIGDPKIEAVEGFWIPRPWSYSESCPPRRDAPVPAAPTPPAAPTLGLAQLFGADASRVSQRQEKPFDYVSKLGENERLPIEHGFQLVLEGRLATFPSGRVARCWNESPDHRPVCLFAVKLERVAFKSTAKTEVLAEWRE